MIGKKRGRRRLQERSNLPRDDGRATRWNTKSGHSKIRGEINASKLYYDTKGKNKINGRRGGGAQIKGALSTNEFPLER